MSEAPLRAAGNHVRTLIDSLDDIVYTLDVDQRHTGVYGRWVEKTGLTPEFFLGKTARDLFGLEAASIHEAANLRALNGETVIYEWSMPGREAAAYYQTAVSPLRDQQGAIVGIAGLGREITRQKQAEAALQQLNAELEQRVTDRTRELIDVNLRLAELDRLKTEFITRINQELRTPLTSITTYTELMTYGQPAKQERHIRGITEQAVRLRQLIESLLDLQQLHVGQIDVNLELVDLNDLVSAICAGQARRRARAAAGNTVGRRYARPVD